MDKTIFFQEAKNIWEDLSFKLDKDADAIISKLYRIFFKKSNLDSEYADTITIFCDILDDGGMELFRAATSKNLTCDFDSTISKLSEKFEVEDVTLAVETVAYVFKIDLEKRKRERVILNEKKIEERKTKSIILQNLESYVNSKREFISSLEKLMEARGFYRQELQKIQTYMGSYDFCHCNRVLEDDDPEEMREYWEEHFDYVEEDWMQDSKVILDILQSDKKELEELKGRSYELSDVVRDAGCMDDIEYFEDQAFGDLEFFVEFQNYKTEFEKRLRIQYPELFKDT